MTVTAYCFISTKLSTFEQLYELEMSQFCPKAIGRFTKAKCYRQPLWHFPWFSSKMSLLCCCTIHSDAICNYSDESCLIELHFCFCNTFFFFFLSKLFLFSENVPSSIFDEVSLTMFVLVLEYQLTAYCTVYTIICLCWGCFWKISLILTKCIWFKNSNTETAYKNKDFEQYNAKINCHDLIILCLIQHVASN